MKYNNYICFLIFLAFSSYAYSKPKSSLDFLSKSKNSASFRQQISKKGEDYYIHFYIDSICIENDSIIQNSFRLRINGLFENHNEGEPALLFKRDFYEVPDNSKICVTMLDSNYVDIPMALSPARPFYKQNDNDASCCSILPISSYQGFFPQNTISYRGEEQYRGRKIISLCVIPIKYNYQEQKMRVYKDATYKISFIQQESSESECKRIVPTDKFIQNLVQNNTLTSTEYRTRVEDCTQDYLILTTPLYESSARVFAEWKRTLGFNTKIIINNIWTSDLISNCIQEEYTLSNSLYYMLLLGDNSSLPAQTAIIQNNDTCFTDFLYGCIDGDLIPDIHVGRLPVETVEEANVAINKIINYEQHPIQEESFYKKALICTHFVPKNNNQTEESARRFAQTAEETAQYLLSLGKNINRLYYADSNVTPLYWFDHTQIPDTLQSPSEWVGSANGIMQRINQGTFFVLHRGHGNTEFWQQPFFHTSHINTLTNGNKLPVVFSINCLTGSFQIQNGKCFGETLLLNPNGGAVAFIGATKETDYEPNNYLTCGMVNAIWPEPGYNLSFSDSAFSYSNAPIRNISQILNIGKMHMRKASAMYTDETIEHNLYVYNCLGDPSMVFHTEKPTEFDCALVTRETDKIIVQPYEESIVSFYNTNTLAVQSFYTDGEVINYSCDPTNFIVSIHYHNRIPYIQMPIEEMYLQNQSIQGNQFFNAQKVYIGSNVTNVSPNGPVTFSSGNIKISANEVEINGETTIQVGTSFEITTGN